MPVSLVIETGIWLFVTLAAFLLCTFLPIRIQDPDLRRKVMIRVLVPVSLLIILYVYPAGIELFSKFAVSAGS